MFWDIVLEKDKAAIWFLGQSGFYIKSCSHSLLIDPYLSDSVGEVAPPFARAYPVPVNPKEIRADIYIVTHDHLDHLDPKTIAAYLYKDQTNFVAPRHAAKKLEELGISKDRISVVDHGDSVTIHGVTITGVFALGTSPDVIDTTGYLIQFENGRSIYHTSDTTYCHLLMESCPHADILLTCINGKDGNLNAEQAVKLTKVVNPKYVIPHHYDVMALNSENPETFRYYHSEAQLESQCVILNVLEKFEW